MRDLSLQDESFIKAVTAYIKSEEELSNRSYTNEFFDSLDEVEKDVYASYTSKSYIIHVLYTYDKDINKLILFYLNYYLNKELDKLYDSINPIVSEENVNKIFVDLQNIIYKHEMNIGYEIDKHFILLIKIALRCIEGYDYEILKVKESSNNKMKKYDDINLSVKNESNLYPVKLNKKYGFVKANFIEVIPCKYDIAYPFINGLALVKLNNKFGFINEDGEEVVPCKYDDAFSFDAFDRNLALVKLNYKYGFIDKTGKEVIPCIYNECGLFYADAEIDLIKAKLKTKWGLLDKNGKQITSFIYDYIYEVRNGFVEVLLKDQLGLLDQQGKEIVPCEYNWINIIDKDEIFKAEKNGKLGFIDIKSDPKKFIVFENELEVNDKHKIQFTWYKDNYVISTLFYYGYLNKEFEIILTEDYKLNNILLYNDYMEAIFKLKEDRNIIRKLTNTMKNRLEDFVAPMKQLFKDLL